LTDRPGTFPPELLERIDAAEEVRIETSAPSKGDGATRRTIIWIVVDEGDVFIRSVRGERGAWYRQLLKDGRGMLHVDGEAVNVRATPASDPDSIERTSRALERKYKRFRGSLAAMLQPHTLSTTLRLEPA
jgi:hypothetical protein